MSAKTRATPKDIYLNLNKASIIAKSLASVNFNEQIKNNKINLKRSRIFSAVST